MAQPLSAWRSSLVFDLASALGRDMGFGFGLLLWWSTPRRQGLALARGDLHAGPAEMRQPGQRGQCRAIELGDLTHHQPLLAAQAAAEAVLASLAPEAACLTAHWRRRVPTEQKAVALSNRDRPPDRLGQPPPSATGAP